MRKIGLFAYGEMGHATLKSLISNFTVQWVILPNQKKQTATEKLTLKLANQYRIPVISISSNEELFNLIFKESPDVVVIASFNKIIPQNILQLTKFINIHIGDLPRYRGRAIVNWAIINNEKNISLVIHEAVPDLDSGDIYATFPIPITSQDTVNTIYDAIKTYLIKNASKIINQTLNGAKGIKQTGKPTYCCTRIPQDGLINWNKTTKEIYNFIRAQTYPYPGAFTYFEGKKMIIWDAEIPSAQKIYAGKIPGRIASLLPHGGVEVLTGDASLIIKHIQYQKKEYKANEIIKSSKHTLGINLVELYEKINKLLEKNAY